MGTNLDIKVKHLTRVEGQRVSMDLITLDVTGIPPELVQPGEMVDLIGPDVSLEEVAERAGTVNYEILTGLSQRARRNFLGGPDPAV